MGCSAPNCTNRSEKGIREFRFPTDAERRKKWIVNCKRDSWTPGPGARICEIHFEESQFESSRKDGRRKLKSNAIPTLFDVLNLSKSLQSDSVQGIGLPKVHSSDDCDSHDIPSISSEVSHLSDSQKVLQLSKENEELKKRIKELEKESALFQERYNKLKQDLSRFLTEEQIETMKKERKSISKWSQDGILKGLKLRFGLGKHGYNFLRTTGYPAPAYSTLNDHIKTIKMPHGILHNVIDLLKTKTANMTPLERECCLSIDEMEISSTSVFDNSSMSFVGKTTLGDVGDGNHSLVVLLRGLQTPWKQIVAHEVTAPSTKGENIRNLVVAVIEACLSAGLQVKAVISDMASSNQSFWHSVGVQVSKSIRIHNFFLPSMDDPIFVLADVPHLLKNLKSATLKHSICIPENVKDSEQLPSKLISVTYLTDLWKKEMEKDSGLRSLHHLKKEHLFPTQFDKMNVALAVQFFSIKTAAAIEKAVALKQTHSDALTLAWWIRLINQWFELMTSRNHKTSISNRNCKEKVDFLIQFIDIIQDTQIGNKWMPLNTGLIMSTLSVIELATSSFERGYDFFLPGRLTQDALENVFSQVHRRAGVKPSALSVKQAIKGICISQFISDINETNYTADSDYHLLDFDNYSEIARPTTEAVSPLKVKENIDPQPSTSTSVVDSNDIYYIAGAAVNTISSKYKLCEMCIDSLTVPELSIDKSITSAKLLTDLSNMGGLKHPSTAVYRICEIAETAFQINLKKLVDYQLPMTEDFIEELMLECCMHTLPECCTIKKKIITYYLRTRCTAVTKHQQSKRKLQDHNSSFSMSKKACKR